MPPATRATHFVGEGRRPCSSSAFLHISSRSTDAGHPTPSDGTCTPSPAPPCASSLLGLSAPPCDRPPSPLRLRCGLFGFVVLAAPSTRRVFGFSPSSFIGINEEGWDVSSSAN